ncbi:hypothetical protein [Thermococcus sp.]|uniref:hypothetical protein n=1 Tax=Thermococcus sp. TaxID=35749 RepID=UPI002627C6A4|nr:hypothetical protein [Thermococcus sp.]
MRPLQLSTYLLVLYGFLLLGEAYYSSSTVYLAFALFTLLLAYFVGRKNRTAVKVALIYAGITLFVSILSLMYGKLGMALDAVISFFIVHDILSYIEMVYKEEKEN